MGSSLHPQLGAEVLASNDLCPFGWLHPSALPSPNWPLMLRGGKEKKSQGTMVICHLCLAWQLCLCPPTIQRVLSDELRFRETFLSPRKPLRKQDWCRWGQGRSNSSSHSALALTILSSPSHQWCAPHTNTPSPVPEAPGTLNEEWVLMNPMDHGIMEPPGVLRQEWKLQRLQCLRLHLFLAGISGPAPLVILIPSPTGCD